MGDIERFEDLVAWQKARKMTKAIYEAGGNILAMGTFLGEDPTNGLCTIKVDGIAKDAVVQVLKPFVQKFEDIREV